jgi:hypothetical protein
MVHYSKPAPCIYVMDICVVAKMKLSLKNIRFLKLLTVKIKTYFVIVLLVYILLAFGKARLPSPYETKQQETNAIA